MKKILFTLLLGLLSLNLYAQHMKFNGVEMTGTLNSFVAKLKAKGWRDYTNIDEDVKNDPTIAALTINNWAGFVDPLIIVCGSPKSRIVSQVMFFLPVSSNGFNDAFFSLTRNLSSIYGDPALTIGETYYYRISDANDNQIGSIAVYKEYDYSYNALKGYYMDDKGYNLNKREEASDL